MGRWIAVVMAALWVGLAAPGAASASISVTRALAQPQPNGELCGPSAGLDAAAGMHHDFCVSFDLGGTETIKGLTLALPPGVVGDPTATPTCSREAFRTESCTTAQQVGFTSAAITSVGLPLLAWGEVYNLAPDPGEPARLGILLDQGAAFLDHVRLESPIRVRVADAGLTSTVTGIPDTTNVLGTKVPIQITAMNLQLWGTNTDAAGAPIAGRSLLKPFISLPTRCDADAVTTMSVVGWDGGTATGSAAYRPTDCDQVPFTPALEATPTQVPADTPGEASTTIVLPAGDTNGRRQAYLRSVALHLPPGLDLNPPLADGLVPCTDEQFGFGLDAPPNCPASSEIGSVEFTTPLFPEPLTGKVYFGAPKPGQALRNFVSVEDPRLRLKLLGIGTVDPQTGQVTATFPDSPQVPFTRFKFTYNGGPHAALTSPTTCGPSTVTADLTPWTATPTTTAQTTFDVVDCPAPAFTPTLEGGVSDTTAGGNTALTLRVLRPDRQLRLQRMAFALPPGLIGRITAVPACSVDDARAARCAPESQIGTARIAVGTGPAPLSLPGRVFLTGGFDGGLAGMAIFVDATLPALNLGTVVTLAKLSLRDDGGIDVVSEDLPQRVQGLATVYRSIELTIDKAGFLRNATDCSAFAVHGTFMAVGGTTATADTPYAATGCGALPFAPKLSAMVGTKGQNAVHGHPPVTVTVDQAAGESAMKRTAVTLPAGIGVDLKNLTALCSADQLAARTCPAASRIGTVRAVTPLLPIPLTGGVFLTAGPKGQPLPGIALDLGLLRLTGTVGFTKTNRVQTIFDAVPDVPLTELTLALDGGKKGLLATSIDLCTVEPVVQAGFTAHSGRALAAKAQADVVGCEPVTATGKVTGVAKNRPALRMAVGSAKTLKHAKIELPSQLRPVSSKLVSDRARVVIHGRQSKTAGVRWTDGRIVVTLPKGTKATAFQLALPAGVLRETRPTKAGAKLDFSVSVTAVDGWHRNASTRLTAGA